MIRISLLQPSLWVSYFEKYFKNVRLVGSRMLWWPSVLTNHQQDISLRTTEVRREARTNDTIWWLHHDLSHILSLIRVSWVTKLGYNQGSYIWDGKRTGTAIFDQTIVSDQSELTILLCQQMNSLLLNEDDLAMVQKPSTITYPIYDPWVEDWKLHER